MFMVVRMSACLNRHSNDHEHLHASNTESSTRSKSQSCSQHHGKKGGIKAAIRVPRITKSFFFGNSGFIVGEKARNGVPFLPVLILSERSSPSRVRFSAPKKRRALDCCGPL